MEEEEVNEPVAIFPERKPQPIFSWELYYCSVDLNQLYRNARGLTMECYRKWMDTLRRSLGGGDMWKDKEILRRMNYIERELIKKRKKKRRR